MRSKSAFVVTPMVRRRVLGGVLGLFLYGAPAEAATIWADWSFADPTGFSGFALASLPGASSVVLYLGELDSATIDGTSTIWSPDTSFVGGTVTASPSTVGDALFLDGTLGGSTSTITFSNPVRDPVIAIWSLGASDFLDRYIFFDGLLTVQAGGPNSQFGGSSVTVGPAVAPLFVFGTEGNGVVQLSGLFSSISFNASSFGSFAFNVGFNAPDEPPVPVPEPSSLLLLAAGGARMIRRRLRQRP